MLNSWISTNHPLFLVCIWNYCYNKKKTWNNPPAPWKSNSATKDSRSSAIWCCLVGHFLIFLWNAGNHLPSNIASHPRRLESSIIALWRQEISTIELISTDDLHQTELLYLLLSFYFHNLYVCCNYYCKFQIIHCSLL